MAKRRVLLVAPTYPPAHGGGGLQLHRMYRRIAKSLELEVTALTQAGRGFDDGETTFEGFRVYRTKEDSRISIQFDQVAELLDSDWATFDLVHAMGDTPTVLAACVWAHQLSLPIVREACFSNPIPTGTDLYSKLLCSSYRNAERCIAINESIHKDFIDIGIPPERSWLRPYPVETDKFRPASSAERKVARNSIGISDEETAHLLIGRFGSRKNQAFAVRVLYTNSRLIIVLFSLGRYLSLQKLIWTALICLK